MPPHSWSPVDLLVLAAEPPSSPTISGLVYPARRHLFSGEPETGKTWAALVLSAAEIHAGRSVLVVDFETGHRAMLERLRDLGLTDEEIASRFIYVAPSEPLRGAVLADVETLLLERKPSLVVFDAFVGALEIHGFDPNAAVEVERFFRTIVSPFQAHDAAVVLLDHLAKDKDKRGKFSIGSERKLGGVDVHLGFEALRPFGRGKTGLAKILTHKDRPGYLPRPKTAELELSSDAETGRIKWEIRPSESVDEEHPFRPTILMQMVSEYVAGRPADDPPSRNTVESNVGKNRESVRKAMDLLTAEGYVREEPGPHRARLLRFVKPYREADDDAS